MIRTIHDLWVGESFYRPISTGEKTFVISENDKCFQRGDFIRFAVSTDDPVDPPHKMDALYEITYVMSGWGLKNGFVALGIRRSEEAETHE